VYLCARARTNCPMHHCEVLCCAENHEIEYGWRGGGGGGGVTRGESLSSAHVCVEGGLN